MFARKIRVSNFIDVKNLDILYEYMCIYVYIHGCIYPYSAYICNSLNISVFYCIHVYMYICICVNMYTYMYICARVLCLYFMYTYIYKCILIYVHIFI